MGRRRSRRWSRRREEREQAREQAREEEEREQAREEKEREKRVDGGGKLERGYNALNWSSMWRAKEAVSESIRISQATSESSSPDWASSNKAACSSV